MKSSSSDIFAMGACVMFNKFNGIDNLNRKIPNFYKSYVLIVAAMYSSDVNFKLLANTVNYSKIT